MMVALSEILFRAAPSGVKELVFGMAHRGRLNVLANFMKKPFAVIFNEFSDKYAPDLGEASGDVKYHLGHGHEWITSSGQFVHLSLCFNPSHLEFVNGVALGRARVKQDRVRARSRPPLPRPAPHHRQVTRPWTTPLPSLPMPARLRMG